MSPARWPLQNDRPFIQVELSLPGGGQDLGRRLLADTGAGHQQSVWQLLLDENDCLQSGAVLVNHVQLGGAYFGAYPVYLLQVRMPQLNFDELVPVVGVSQVPAGFEGIAGFKFLNRFHYGNFGNPDCFGLDLLPIP